MASSKSPTESRSGDADAAEPMQVFDDAREAWLDLVRDAQIVAPRLDPTLADARMLVLGGVICRLLQERQELLAEKRDRLIRDLDEHFGAP
jgi:hypothetical protein